MGPAAEKAHSAEDVSFKKRDYFRAIRQCVDYRSVELSCSAASQPVGRCAVGRMHSCP